MKLRFAALVVLTIVFSFQSNGQEVDYEWAKSYGSSAAFEIGHDVTTDSDGNLYATGTFKNSVDFDIGPGSFVLTAAEGQDGYTVKMDSDGNFIWATSIAGATGNDENLAVTIDPEGNVLIAGEFRGTCDFDPGDDVYELSSAGISEKTFIQKLDSDGNFIWAVAFTSSTNNNPTDIITDDSGNVYVTGKYRGTTDFDPGPAYVPKSSSGFGDGYLVKLDSDGIYQWATTVFGEEYESTQSVTIDFEGNVITTGGFQMTVDFDPSADEFNVTSNGASDMFIQKLDSDGNLIWVKTLGDDEGDGGGSVITDNLGYIYTIGGFNGTVDFDPNDGVTNKTSHGGGDFFIHKLSPDGDFEWVNIYGASFSDRGSDLTLDTTGNIYATGYFTLTVDFNPGEAGGSIAAVLEDAYILKLDSDGNYIWAISYGGEEEESSESIHVDIHDNIFTTGDFYEVVDFNPGLGVNNRTSHGLNDAYLLKLSQCFPNGSTDTIVSCDAYTWVDGTTYTDDNYEATYVYENIDGCDSTVTLHLTINSNTGIDIINSCEPYTWIDGIEYSEDNFDATFTLTNIYDCDSVVTLNLDIQSNTGIAEIEGCDTYTWIDGIEYTESNFLATHTLTNGAGCDSVVTLNLTMNYSTEGTDIITACNSHVWIDGNTYNTDNDEATFALTNASGCDSIVTLNLTIEVVDVSVTATEFDLTANAEGAEYRWLNCNADYLIVSGEFDQIFIPENNGSYAVRVDNGICIDTSECYEFFMASVEELPLDGGIQIYPNPTDGLVYVEFTAISSASFELYTLAGSLLYRQKEINTPLYSYELNQPAGTYFIRIISEEGVLIHKLILN